MSCMHRRSAALPRLPACLPACLHLPVMHSALPEVPTTPSRITAPATPPRPPAHGTPPPLLAPSVRCQHPTASAFVMPG